MKKCTRIACDVKEVNLPYVHIHTRLEYCAHCGFKINAACAKEYPDGVCQLKPEFKELKK